MASSVATVAVMAVADLQVAKEATAEADLTAVTVATAAVVVGTAVAEAAATAVVETGVAEAQATALAA